MADLTVKEEAYCQGIAKHGRKEKVKAYTEAGYSTNMNKNALGVSADKLYNKPKIALRIDELMKVVEEIAEKEFSISVEWRLQRLKAISDAGMTKYNDGNGAERYENLAASNASIKTLNEMLGTSECDDDQTGKPIAITFSVNPAVGNVTVVKGE